MPASVPQFHVTANNPGEIYGCDVTDIKGNQHLMIDCKSVCIFKRKLPNMMSTSVIEALKSIFCDIGAPDRFVTDNACYFMSEEFANL